MQALWHDGDMGAPRPVVADLAPGPQGPRLRLLALSGAVPLADIPARGIDWPDLRARSGVRTVTIDLGVYGWLEAHDVASWRQALRACRLRRPGSRRLPWPWLLAAALLGAGLLSAGLLAGWMLRLLS